MTNYDKRFYGIYEGVCTNNQDPENQYKIKLQVPQVLGLEETEWAPPCLPVTANSNHPDHIAHTAAEVAALLASHSLSVTSASGGSPAHTHTVTATLSHSGSSGTLTHPHVSTVDADKLWNDSDEITTSLPEHTPHRLVPKLGQKVWVMFIGGDPNFPVWMGVQL